MATNFHAAEKNNTLELNSNLFTVLFSARLADNNPTDMTLFLYLCALPCLVGITINLCQMTLTLFLKPVFAFFASCVYIIAGMYYANPLFISNYAIPVRGKVMGVYNFSFSSGAIICIIFCCTAIFVGAIRINKMDLMNY